MLQPIGNAFGRKETLIKCNICEQQGLPRKMNKFVHFFLLSQKQ